MFDVFEETFISSIISVPNAIRHELGHAFAFSYVLGEGNTEAFLFKRTREGLTANVIALDKKERLEEPLSKMTITCAGAIAEICHLLHINGVKDIEQNLEWLVNKYGINAIATFSAQRSDLESVRQIIIDNEMLSLMMNVAVNGAYGAVMPLVSISDERLLQLSRDIDSHGASNPDEWFEISPAELDVLLFE